MTLQELEARLKTLEDIEEINKLQRAYGYYVEHWEGQQMADLFSDSPDVTVDIGRGAYVGQEGIKKFFLRGKMPPDFLHATMQLSGIVDVDRGGKTAKGRWYGFSPQAKSMEGTAEGVTGGVVRAVWTFGIYENEYVKQDGKWKIKKLIFSTIFNTPYEDGWVKTPRPPYPIRIPDGAKPGPSTIYKPYLSGYIFPYHYKNPVTGK